MQEIIRESEVNMSKRVSSSFRKQGHPTHRGGYRDGEKQK